MKFFWMLPLPMSKMSRERVCLGLIRTAWETAFFFSPWIRRSKAPSYDEEWETMRKKLEELDVEVAAGKAEPRPLMVLGNHSSFLDVPVSATCLPAWAFLRSRTYMGAFLFGVPLISTVCKSVGHFPVYFASKEDGVFKVEHDKMEKVEKEVDQFVAKGGWMAFFPEGQVNKTPDEILPFRYGGMKKALVKDAPLIMFVAYGNPKICPANAMIGGKPGRIRYGAKVVAPDGCKALCKKWRDEGLAEDERALPDEEIMAKRLRKEMQDLYNSLKADVEGSGKI